MLKEIILMTHMGEKVQRSYPRDAGFSQAESSVFIKEKVRMRFRNVSNRCWSSKRMEVCSNEQGMHEAN